MSHAERSWSTTTFHFTAAAEVLRGVGARVRLRVEREGRWFEGEGGVVRVVPPLVARIGAGCAGVEEYLAGVPERLGRHLVVLMQAGAVSLGLFDGGEEVETKSFRRYVVRGSGKAQPKHLEQKGKSRYGSRLRLQNATRLLEETNERLVAWHREYGEWETIFASCPVRLWPSLWEVEPRPPFAREREVVRIPKDLPRPTTELLLRTYRGCQWGRIEWRDGEAGTSST
jgi:hypothetical protein